MNKRELVREMADANNMTYSFAEQVLDSFISIINSEIKKPEGRVKIAELGTFTTIHRNCHAVVVPKDQVYGTEDAYRCVKFIPSKRLKHNARNMIVSA